MRLEVCGGCSGVLLEDTTRRLLDVVEAPSLLRLDEQLHAVNESPHYSGGETEYDPARKYVSDNRGGVHKGSVGEGG